MMHVSCTQRLKLRPWIPEDEPDIIEGLNNLEVSRWLALVPYPYTTADAKAWITFCQQAGNDRFDFAIETLDNKKVIGGVSLLNIDYKAGKAGGGIWINAQYQGKGYGREAFNEKIAFAFETLHLDYLENGLFKGNVASLQMQQKLGYTLQGVNPEPVLCMADQTLKTEYITSLEKKNWIKYHPKA